MTFSSPATRSSPRRTSRTEARNQADLLSPIRGFGAAVVGQRQDVSRSGCAAVLHVQWKRSKSDAPVSAGHLQDDRSGHLHKMQAPALVGATVIGSVGRRSREREGLGSCGVIVFTDSDFPIRLITLGWHFSVRICCHFWARMVSKLSL